MDRAAAVIVGGVGLVLLVLVAFVWAGPDALLGSEAPGALATPTDRAAPDARARPVGRADTPPGDPTTSIGSTASSAAPVSTPSTGVPTPSTGVPTPSTGVPTPSTGVPTPTTATPPVSAAVPLPGGLAERLAEVPRVVRFAYRSATLDDAAATTMLDALAPELVALVRARPDVVLVVRGHTDDSGPEEGNVRLGADRAQAVVDRLVARGVPAAALRSRGLAAAIPVADNDTDEGRAANRRADLVVTTETAGS